MTNARFGLVLGGFILAAGVTPAADPPPHLATRLFIQDDATRTLKWADVSETAAGELTLGPVTAVDGFPALDAAKQKLSQMRAADGKILVAVRDTVEGKFGSGWAFVYAGSRHMEHGDHSHWNYRRKPATWAMKIDADQGNPAHVYAYANKLFLVHDGKNGSSRFDPAEFVRTVSGDVKPGTPKFLAGGGGHITLAVTDDKLAFATWIDADGPNAGKVDVTAIPAGTVSHSFTIPGGALHGATAAAGKAFFAAKDGVYWTAADAAPLKATRISLGEADGKPIRTGAFATHGPHVLCVTGTDASAKLVVIDAREAEPKPVFVPLSAAGKPANPVVVTVNKLVYTMVIRETGKDAATGDSVDVIALDGTPKLAKTIALGKATPAGHGGHHDACVDNDGKTAYVTNPADGTITAIDTTTWAVKATFKVGGTPTAVLAHGGRETED